MVKNNLKESLKKLKETGTAKSYTNKGLRILFFNISQEPKEEELHVLGIFENHAQAVKAAKRYNTLTPKLKLHRYVISTALEMGKLPIENIKESRKASWNWKTWGTYPIFKEELV